MVESGGALTTAVNTAYTVRIGADAGAAGLALAEVYDADALGSQVELINVTYQRGALWEQAPARSYRDFSSAVMARSRS